MADFRLSRSVAGEYGAYRLACFLRFAYFRCFACHLRFASRLRSFPACCRCLKDTGPGLRVPGFRLRRPFVATQNQLRRLLQGARWKRLIGELGPQRLISERPRQLLPLAGA
ncbi:hypothetical protein D3C81_710830 [compost metagenome]